jgi:hypothetical protein
LRHELTQEANSVLGLSFQSVLLSSEPFARMSFEFFKDLAVADILDLACMKLSALASRGTRRDFVDLYVVAQRNGLAPLLEQFDRKFAQVSYNRVHILKSLVFFADAEKEPLFTHSLCLGT